MSISQSTISEENKTGSEICCTDDNCPDKREKETRISKPATLREVLEDNKTDPMTLTEAITLVLEPAEYFVEVSKVGTIGRSTRLKKAISYLRQFVEN